MTRLVCHPMCPSCHKLWVRQRIAHPNVPCRAEDCLHGGHVGKQLAFEMLVLPHFLKNVGNFCGPFVQSPSVGPDKMNQIL